MRKNGFTDSIYDIFYKPIFRTKIPLYGILSNEQHALMAQNPPKTKEDSLKIKGVNEHKFKQFGDVFISTIEKALLTVEESEVLDVFEKLLEPKQSHQLI